MNFEIICAPAGDCAFMVTLGFEISEEVNNRVHALQSNIENTHIDGIMDMTPTYCALMISYNPLKISYNVLAQRVKQLANQANTMETTDSNVIYIPTVYGGMYGPDLETVARLNDLDVNEVIRIHSEQTYRIFMLGFTPGFPYLGGLDARIATPRLDKPRLKIPAGSVGIAGSQTGIYPLDSPGGWQIIGRTPLNLYNPHSKDPILLRAGDSLRFVPVSPEEFEAIFENSADINENEAPSHLRLKPSKTIEIIKPGLLTLVEDLGRYGYGQYGVPVAGVMDSFAAIVANILVSNPRTAAVLEFTYTGPEIRFDFAGNIAITGAALSPSINGIRVNQWQTIHVNAGDILSFGSIKSGMRGYLAISGGIDVPCVMNSRSTYMKAMLGGYQGRALKLGDILTIGDNHTDNSTDNEIRLSINRVPIKTLDELLIPNYNRHFKLRVILGPQVEKFTEKGIETFLSNTYQLTSECDRMGIRLEGECIEHVTDADILSDGIAFGAIQVPGTGQPIIMMADRQTTGGYAKIANVISTDLWKLAQAKPGDTISFVSISVETAHDILKSVEKFYLELESDWQVTNY